MDLASGLYFTISQLEDANAPRPLPLESGFSTDQAYLSLGLVTFSESGEAYVALSNDRNELWFISNRHLRTFRLAPKETGFRKDVRDFQHDQQSALTLRESFVRSRSRMTQAESEQNEDPRA